MKHDILVLCVPPQLLDDQVQHNARGWERCTGAPRREHSLPLPNTRVPLPNYATRTELEHSMKPQMIRWPMQNGCGDSVLLPTKQGFKGSFRLCMKLDKRRPTQTSARSPEPSCSTTPTGMQLEFHLEIIQLLHHQAPTSH